MSLTNGSESGGERHTVDVAHLAIIAVLIGLVAFALTLAAVCASGVTIGVEWSSLAKAGLFLGALGWAWRRKSPTGGDERLRLCAGTLFVLLAGSTVNTLVCFVGQTLALPLTDSVLHRADLLLGLDVIGFIKSTVQVAGVPKLLGAAYVSSFPLLLGTVIYLSVRGEAERAWEICTVFCICLLATAIGSVLLPALGAFHYLEVPNDLRAALPPASGIYHLKTVFALRQAEHLVIDLTNFQGVATFPSFHTAMALMTAAAWRNSNRVVVPMTLWQVVVIASTIPIGGHYFIDLAAGALVWVLAHGTCKMASQRASILPFRHSTVVAAQA